MWYLTAFLLCLGVASGGSSQCTCNMKESFFDFVVETEVLSEGEAEGNLKVYDVKGTTMIRPLGYETFGNKVYTNKGTDEGQCGATLEVGKRYILKGKFDGEGQQRRPVTTSCGNLEICSSDSKRKN